MSGWWVSVHARKRALRQSQVKRLALADALQGLRSAHARQPLRLVLAAAASGWAMGRLGVSASLEHAVAARAAARLAHVMQLVLALLR